MPAAAAAARANKVARFQAGVKDAIRRRKCCNTTTVTRGLGKRIVTREIHTANRASHLGQSLSKD